MIVRHSLPCIGHSEGRLNIKIAERRLLIAAVHVPLLVPLFGPDNIVDAYG